MNKIIFSGLLVLVCCLFGEVGVINGKEIDIGGDCIGIEMSNGDIMTPNDLCRAAGYGSCKEVAGSWMALYSGGSCTGNMNTFANPNCSSKLSATGNRRSAKIGGGLFICSDGWGKLRSPGGVPKDLDEAVMNATNWLLGIVSMIAVLVVIWGGINYLTAAGDEEKARKAKKIITYSLIGVAITGLAYGIIKVIIEVILK